MDTQIYYLISTILSIIAVTLTLVGLFFACLQLWQIKVNRKRQFEQSRREKTVDMVVHYTQCISNETKYAERIVSTFSDEQCRDLYNCIPFSINQKTKNKICTICPNKSKCETLSGLKYCQTDKDNYCVKDTLLYFLRGHIITYLNSLESVLLAWQLGIVEQKTIEEQFIFLNKKSQNERTLEVFRSIAGGGHSYPAIEKFYQHLNQKEIEEAKKSLKDILE